jgi:glycosyltransferase involved in cell wall biosynthesis
LRIVVFLNELSIGGTEKAACRWARGLADLGHDIHVLTLKDGPRRVELESRSIPVYVTSDNRLSIANKLRQLRPTVIHAHAPGHPHAGDILGDALKGGPRIPVVQTNIFGRFDNPKEDTWTNFRLFISWTSCVQAARRSFQRLDQHFFRRASVAVYPVDPDDGPAHAETARFRRAHGIEDKDIVLGRLSRPEPNKWTNLPIEAFRTAARKETRLRLLLREPPAFVAWSLQKAIDRDRFIILPATSDSSELALTTASIDVVLHTTLTGESFGYGIAEPMNYSKPVIANSTPWLDQAQIELVRHGECGFIASSSSSISDAVLNLVRDPALRAKFGQNAKNHIRSLADPSQSIARLESVLDATASGNDNPRVIEDMSAARSAARYLDGHQFGNSWNDQLALRSSYYRTRIHDLRKLVQMVYSRPMRETTSMNDMLL